LTFVVCSCKAQTNIINITDLCNQQTSYRNGTLYLKDISNKYAPFVGTWKWTEGNKELILTLFKQTKYHYNLGSDNYYEDRMVGYYVYKENGNIVVSSSTISLNSELPDVLLDFDCYSHLVTQNFVDILKNKRYDGWIELVSPTSIKFHLKEDFHMRIHKEGYPALPPVYEGNTFPLDMVLIKQP